MRVLVVTSDVPLVEGGHRVIARSLVQALRDEGHQAEIFTTPQNRLGRQLSAYWATWLTDVGETGDGHPVDAVISLRYPSYAVRHPRHVVWLNHRLREYYDLWPTFRATLGPRGRLVQGVRRQVLHALDRRILKSRVVFAQSDTIRQRLDRWGALPSQVLHPPPPQRPYRCDGYDGAILSVARLQPLKRTSLLVESVAAVPGARARIAGEGPELEHLQVLAESLQASDRIAFLGRLSEESLVEEYGRCSAVWYGARAEDYGLVTLEAFNSSKPVITCDDSGGPAELVEDDVTGLVVAPDIDAVSAAVRRLQDPDYAAELGTAALNVAARHSWKHAVDTLLGAI
ncbi:MAG: glycosyltransferase [Acidobacteria bacterium]|nr:glycosyltransferase [Acidobacteriota bacterium]